MVYYERLMVPAAFPCTNRGHALTDRLGSARLSTLRLTSGSSGTSGHQSDRHGRSSVLLLLEAVQPESLTIWGV